MTGRIVAWCAGHPAVVLAAALLAALAGELSRRSLRRDVLPDLSDPQIVLVADWMGHPAPEVASAVTQVLTAALDGLPGSTAVRGSSMAGMAYVDVVFAPGAGLETGRRAIAGRVAAVRALLPPEARVEVGPVASSTGWVFEYALVDPSHGETPLALRRFQEDVLRPALAALPGVAEVASVGGEVSDVQVDLRPEKLRERALAFSDVALSLRASLSAARPGFRELDAMPLPGGTGDPPLLRDVARVRLGHDMARGLADLGGTSPAVGGIVVARPDADVPSVAGAVRRALDEQRAHLRGGTKIVTVYDRSSAVADAQRTLARALVEEVAVVALVILLFLFDLRSALVPLVTLPLVVLCTFAAMWIAGLPATVMSLGGIGIALGLSVDAEVVALEACHRALDAAAAGKGSAQMRAGLVAAAVKLGPAVVKSLLIAALSFLPVLAFSGETGRLLRPLALTKTFVILAAALVAVTVAPALRDRLLRGPVTPEFDNPLTRALVRAYRPFVHFALRQPVLTLLVAALALTSAVPIAWRLGGEFLPRVDEGDLLFMPTALPGAPPEEVAAQLRLLDGALARAPEVESVFGKVGRADSATDPAPLSMVEATVRLRPRDEWPRYPRERWYSRWAPQLVKRALRVVWPEEARSGTEELIARLDREARLPGWTGAWTAPARARIDMMATGIRTPVGIRVSAADPARLERLGGALRAMAARLPGTRSAWFESPGGEMWLQFEPDPGALAAHLVDAGLAAQTARLALSGGQIGELETGGRRLRVHLAQDLNARGPADALRELTVRSAAGARDQPIPLALLGRLSYAAKASTLRSEGGKLVAYVHVDLQGGTDVGSYVARARRELSRMLSARELTLDGGEQVEWMGQYPLLLEGARRLRFIVPLVLLSMLALLYLQFRNLAEALIVLVSVPFALVGSFWTLHLLGYPFSAPVWVGLLSVAGLAMQTAVVTVVYIDDAFYRRLAEGRLRSREDIVAAHAEGTIRRLRPKIMTVSTMAAGLLPLLWAEGAGAEIMRRVAAPMVGGLASSAFLTLEVLPVLYTLWRARQLARARRLGIDPLRAIGGLPAWVRAAAMDR